MELLSILGGIPEGISESIITGLYILPGLVTYYIFRYCRRIKTHSTFEILILSLLFTIINLLIFNIVVALAIWVNELLILITPHVYLLSDIHENATNWFNNPIATTEIRNLLFNKIYILYFIATLLGIFIVWIEEKDGILDKLRKLKITNRSNRKCIWADIEMYNFDTYVRIYSKENDGKTMYQGFMKYYSDTLDPLEIFLIDVTIYEVESTNIFDVVSKVAGIYIKGDMINSIHYIELPNEPLLKKVNESSK